MNWKNLHEGRCPYCSNTLEERDGQMKCVQCRFSMTLEKYDNMRIGAPRPLKWQNLRDGKCPQCSSFLKEAEDKTRLVRCVKAPTCPFKIGEERLREIITNKGHSAHRYDAGDHEGENLERLNNL